MFIPTSVDKQDMKYKCFLCGKELAVAERHCRACGTVLCHECAEKCKNDDGTYYCPACEENKVIVKENP